MSRYSPTVLPEAGPDWGRGIIDAARLAYELKRQGAEDDLKRRDADIGYYGKGGRTGTAPAESMESVTVPDVPTFNAPDPSMLGNVLRGGSLGRPTPQATPPFAPPGNDQLGRVLSGGGMIEQNGITGVAPAPSAYPIDYPGQDAGQEQTPRRDRAQLHPGAFDPGTRTFGGSPLQMAVAQAHAAAPNPIASPGRTVPLPNTNPRYVQLDAGHYVDNLHTPDAERDRDREAQARLASELRGVDIDARGRQAQTLEDVRQQGRVDIRERINQAHLAEILARGDVSGENSAAHDARLDKRSAAHDARVGARTGAGSGGRPQTAGQRELNARMAADGVLAATDGSYDKAVDWLRNTPEGQDAQANGLSPRHLYAAMGKYHNLLSAQSIRLQAGAAMDTPEEATTAIDETRHRVAGRGKAPAAGAAAAPSEATMSDADLWEAKVAAGMSKEQATAYVKNRKKKP